MPSSSPRRGLRRTGAIVSAAALTAGLAPIGTAQAAVTFKAADDGAKITGYKWYGKSEFDFTVKSPALGGASQKVRVLVPKTWSFTAKRTWPTLYAYHGGRDGYVSWTRSTDIEAYAAKYDVMVAMPEGSNGSYTDWWNGGKGGSPKWETFHTMEVRQLLERNYHSGGLRAAMGNSSGGGGAITYAARHPGMFKYAASFSGVLSMRSPGIPALLMYTNISASNPFDIWGYPELDDANWAAHDPYALAAKLKGTKLFFSSGTTGQPGPGDDPNLAPWDIGLLSERAVGQTAIEFRDRLNALKIPYTSHIYGNGRHAWPAWIREFHSQWTSIMAALGAKKF
ncbi:MAG: hypothetical protein QOE54_1783 [Streptosporangiaceae bacterium]|jgi:S-formylglutathione hydrolase FrmB|nr:putative esterase [Streptosporangiaceae bacterium]MDX6429417.1 hypothetical protein [Streptosporangiaceae bacterium]